MIAKLILTFALVIASSAGTLGQIQKQYVPGQTAPAALPNNSNGDTKSDLRLGPGDLIHITVYDMPELDQHVRVSDQGNVTLSLIGQVKAEGLSAEQLSQEIARKLREGEYAKRPSVNVMVDEYTTQGVTVVGEVVKPGVIPVFSSHDLLDILSSAGGLKDTASTEILIRRRWVDGEPERIQLGRDSKSLSGPIVKVNPGDQVIVPLAGIVYMLGDLNRPGGYVMSENGKITLLQALAMAGGSTRTAAENNTRLVRPTPNGYE